MCNTDLFLASQSLPCFNAGALALFPTGLSRVAGPDQWTHLPVQRAIPSKLQPQSGDSWTTDSKKSWLQNLIETGDYCGMLWVEGWISPNWFGYGWRKSPGFIFKWPRGASCALLGTERRHRWIGSWSSDTRNVKLLASETWAQMVFLSIFEDNFFGCQPFQCLSYLETFGDDHGIAWFSVQRGCIGGSPGDWWSPK